MKQSADPGRLQTSGVPVILRQPKAQADGEVRMYGLGFVLQVAATKAALWCNVRTVGVGHWDFEDGTDAIVFDSLNALPRRPAHVLARNARDTSPETGRPRVGVNYPIGGGFVPRGARRSDNAPHPHAGTGFGFSQVLRHDLNDEGFFTWDQPYTRQWRLHQLVYDGRRLRVLSDEVRDGAIVVGGGPWRLLAPGLSTAIPDGDDLLYPLLANDGSRSAAGVSRWQSEDGGWRPVAFYGISDGSEPSLMRDANGALLYSVRGDGPEGKSVRVWRSRDNAETWEQVLAVPNVRSDAPVALNGAADGTPYIAADRLGTSRAQLCLWPLTEARTALEPPLVARDTVAGFGAPPEGTTWFADHANAATVRLADGQWHNLLVYRVLAFGTSGVGGEVVTPHTGCYVEEVHSAGPAIPVWRSE